MTFSLLLFKLLSVLGLSFMFVGPQTRCSTPEETAKHAFAPPPTCAVEAPVEDKREGVTPPDGSARSIAPSGGDTSADDSDDGISNGI
jgi:hypothetical protein